MVPASLYVAGGALVVFLALGSTALWYRADAISAKADLSRTETALAAVVVVNSANGETIRRLTTYREMDDKLQADLQSKLNELAHQTGLATDAVQQLKDQSADVKLFLGGVIPDDLARLLTERRRGSNKP